MLFPLRVEPGQVRSLILRRMKGMGKINEQSSDSLTVTTAGMESPFWKIDVCGSGVSQISRKTADGSWKPLLSGRGVAVELAEDNRDTWAMMGPGHFLDEPLGVFHSPAPWVIEERGPIRVTLCQTLRQGDSVLVWRVRLYGDSPRIEFDLKLHCREKHKRFTLRAPFAEKIKSHTDGIPGAALQRVPSVMEYPFQDWTALRTADADCDLSILTPDTFSFSVREDNAHFTLLRAAPYAWCGADPKRMARTGDADFTDQGEFRYHFVLLPATEPDELARMARNLQEPPVAWDLTKGMKRYTPYLFGPPREEDLSAGDRG